jgi:hypothetical protein
MLFAHILKIDFNHGKDGKFSSGSSSGSGVKGSEGLTSFREGKSPAFVSQFINDHGTANAMKAKLKGHSKEHLGKALQLMHGHQDSATAMVRGLVQDELNTRK